MQHCCTIYIPQLWYFPLYPSRNPPSPTTPMSFHSPLSRQTKPTAHSLVLLLLQRPRRYGTAWTASRVILPSKLIITPPPCTHCTTLTQTPLPLHSLPNPSTAPSYLLHHTPSHESQKKYRKFVELENPDAKNSKLSLTLLILS